VNRPHVSHGLTVVVPDQLVEALAERTAMLVAERLAPAPRAESPWLDFEGAMAYLGFSRDRLYKLTAARAIPFRKKRDGQGLLFRRDELDRWVEAEYESTGCAAEVELWSTTLKANAPAAQARPGAGNGGDSSDASQE
jgi:excisionase family DNA binding protein